MATGAARGGRPRTDPRARAGTTRGTRGRRAARRCGSVRTSKPGSTPASTGRSRRRSAQKPWMVETCASSRCSSASSSSATSRGACSTAQPRCGSRASGLDRAFSSSLRIRSFSSPAAFSVNVTATISIDRRALPRRDEPDDARDELGRLAGARGGLDDEGVVERLADQVAVCSVVQHRRAEASWARRHGREPRSPSLRCTSASCQPPTRSRQIPQRQQVGEERPCSSSSRASPRAGRTRGGSRSTSQAPSSGDAARNPSSTPRSITSSACRPVLRAIGSSCTVWLVKPAGLRAVVEPSGGHRLAGHLLDDQAVEHRLQRPPAVDRGRRPPCGSCRSCDRSRAARARWRAVRRDRSSRAGRSGRRPTTGSATLCGS